MAGESLDLVADMAGVFLALDLVADIAGEFLALRVCATEIAGEPLTLLKPLATTESSPSSGDVAILLGDDRTRGEDATRWVDAVSRPTAGDDCVAPIDVRFGVFEGGGIVAMVSRLELTMEISPDVSCTNVVEETLLRRERCHVKLVLSCLENDSAGIPEAVVTAAAGRLHQQLALTGLRPSGSEKRSEARLESRRSLGDWVRDCEAERGIVEGGGLSGAFLSGDERKPKSAFIAIKQTKKKTGRKNYTDKRQLNWTFVWNDKRLKERERTCWVLIFFFFLF